MELRFGHDFSRVRVHDDPTAATSADSLNARAYTVGHNIVFSTGEYAPATAAGRRLLAHELTHVLQQHGGATVAQRDPKPGPDMQTPRRPQPGQKPTTVATPAGDPQDWLRWVDHNSSNLYWRMVNFDKQKQWRSDFHAMIEERFQKIRELNDQLVKLQKEFDESTSGFYIFEHESTLRIRETLPRAWKQLEQFSRETMDLRDAEKSYEQQADVQERRVATEAELVQGAAREFLRGRKTITAGDYESLVTGINKAGSAIDQLVNMEFDAQVKYAGPPVSRQND